MDCKDHIDNRKCNTDNCPHRHREDFKVCRNRKGGTRNSSCAFYIEAGRMIKMKIMRTSQIRRGTFLYIYLKIGDIFDAQVFLGVVLYDKTGNNF